MGCGSSKGQKGTRIAPAPHGAAAAANSSRHTPVSQRNLSHPRVRPPLSLDVDPLPADELDAAIARDDALAVTRCLAGAPSASELAARPGLLHAAAEANAAEVIAVLVAAGAPLGYCDDDHQTALHCAVANGHIDAADVLTEKMPCAELSITDKYKMLPLHLACENGDPDLIALLLNRGARVVNSPASPNRPIPVPDDYDADQDAALPVQPGPPPNDPAASDETQPAQLRQPNFGASPVPKRKQLIAMQKSAIGGSAVFIAEQHGHDEAVAMLLKACKGEDIPMPVLRDRAAASGSAQASATLSPPGTDV